jgi:hypothetical protein
LVTAQHHVILGTTWNSLEAAKLFVGILTPVAIFVLGVWGARKAREWDHRQWLRRTHYERRLRFWDEMSPTLNDLLCFFTFVGTYRQLTPPRAIELKREVDRIFFSNAHLFPRPVSAAYADFIDACFQHYTGRAQDAKLRSSLKRQQAERTTWDPNWDPMFVKREADVTQPSDITAKYRHLVQLFTTDDYDEQEQPWTGS